MGKQRPPNAAARRTPLREVVVTDDLRRREPRPADHEAESRALSSLIRAMAAADGDVLAELAETALEICDAHSAGVSILEADGDGEEVFRWHAAAGPWARFLGDTIPRHASPCGVVLERDRAVLMARPERHFHYDLDGVPPIVETLLVPFRRHGKPVGTVWLIAHDEARRFDAEDERLLTSLADCAVAFYQLTSAREAAERSGRSKDSFLATMSHELRTPLNAIQGYADLLHDGVLGEVTDRQRDALHRTKKTAAHLIGLIDEILLFARADGDPEELQLAELDLAELVSEVAGTYGPQAEQKGLELEVVGAEASVPVESDEGKLRHIVSNLVGNAVKYTTAGTVRVELRDREDAVEVRVRDTGPGIPVDRLEKIFEPFERVEAFQDQDPQTGTGLGLAIARRMARTLGGDVTAESTPGEGSAFTFRLPR